MIKLGCSRWRGPERLVLCAQVTLLLWLYAAGRVLERHDSQDMGGVKMMTTGVNIELVFSYMLRQGQCQH